MDNETMADKESPILIDDIRYADPDKYHPHDVLIYKYYSAEDVTTRPNRQQLYDMALMKEEIGAPPHRIPWPLPPTRPREELECGVEEWRASCLHKIDMRIASYDTLEPESSPATLAIISHTGHGVPHRALGVNELLEKILRCATPNAQCAAWSVSKSWRDMVTYILQPQFRDPYPCEPVEYGEVIRPNLGWLQPSKSEIDEFQATVLRMLRLPDAPNPRSFSASFLAARLSHAENLPQSSFNSFRRFCEAVFPQESADRLLRRFGGPRWMDLSQFGFNPYFTHQFEGNVQLLQGCYTIDVKPHILHCLRDRALVMKPTLEQLVGTMFLTSPPCKAIGIYTIHRNFIWDELKLLQRIRRTDGIRIGDVLPRLEQCIPSAIELWRTRVQASREPIERPSWLELSSRAAKRSAWREPGFPKLLVLLESGDQSVTTFAQSVYLETLRHHDL